MTTSPKPTKDDALKPCPFCGAGTTQIVENGRMWTGMKYSEPSSVSVRHWCEPTPGQPSRMLERVGKDHASAVAAWNTREVLAQPAADAKAGGDDPVATKKMRDWIEYLKLQSDNGAYRNIPSAMDSGRCWELANELEQFLNTRPQPQATNSITAKDQS